MRAAAQGHLRPNPMRRHAPLRISQNEPFDILNLAPSITSITLIMNTDDRSYSLVRDTVYSRTQEPGTEAAAGDHAGRLLDRKRREGGPTRWPSDSTACKSR